MMSVLLLARILSMYKSSKESEDVNLEVFNYFEHFEVIDVPKAYIFSWTLSWHVLYMTIFSKEKLSLFKYRNYFTAENTTCNWFAESSLVSIIPGDR